MCYNPLPLPTEEKYTEVSCGKCPKCKKATANGWSFRLMQEDKNSKMAHFVTLTYAEETVPITEKGWLQTLEKTHVQDFMKRLRKRMVKRDPTAPKVKFFAVGEYGTKTWRPHYHLLIYNATAEDIEKAWAIYDPVSQKFNGIGMVHVGTVADASVMYTLKYMMKQGRIPVDDYDDRVPEFRLMSKRLGETYLTEEVLAWHHADLDNRMYCPGKDGKKLSMPRYYKTKIYTDEQRQHIGKLNKARLEKLAKEELENVFNGDMEEYIRVKKEEARNAYRQMYQVAKSGRNL